MSEPNKQDLMSVGQHCSLSTCSRLDFLPVKCDLCGKVFCKDHYSVTSHNCEKFTQPESSSLGHRPLETFPCSFENCQTREIVKVTCEFCHIDFCMKHRLQVDHKCAKLAAANASIDDSKKIAQKEFKFEMKQNVSEKNAALASKLALMKLKQTAQGPPGLTENFKYFCFVVLRVKPESEPSSSSHPFFFSTKWPVGKCIEFVENKLGKLLNGEKNLRLFLNDDQPLETACLIEELMKKGILQQQGLTLYLKKE